MAESKKPRRTPAASIPAPGKTETKAAMAYRRIQEARAAAGAETASGPADAAAGSTTVGATTPGLPPWPSQWPSPPSFSLPQMPMPQNWAGMLPQPGVVQPAPLAVGPLGDRLGSTLRLGIDVINMALAGSLRLLGGAGWQGYGQCHERHSGCHGGCGGGCGNYDCCCVFEHEGCCHPSVGTCCD